MSGYSPPIAARKASPSPATPVFQPRFRQTPLACLIQLAVASSALGLGTWHTQAQAEPLRLAQAASPSTQNYNIPAGPLSTALARFASASGVLVAGAGELAKGKSSPGAFGTLSPRAALDALLAGTDLTAVPSSDGSYSLRKMPQVPAPANEVTQLGTVTVRAQQANPLTEGTGSYTTKSMSTATRLNLSSRETPQSVSVITRQQLDDYNVNTLRDVMRYTPGMYVVESEGVADEYAFQARGFGVDNLMIDGQATDRTNFNMRTISADMNMYDRVEVLRGAAGLLYGVGAPSAAVNLVRKRPTADPLLNLAVGVGSHDRYSATFDGGGAIGPTERVRGRLVGSYQNEHGFVDVSKNNNRSLYGVVELDLTEHTTLGLGASYQRYRANGIYSGKPSYLDGSPVDMPRSAFWGQAWSHQYRETATYFLDLNHEFDNGWKAKLAAMHTTGETDSVYPNIQRIANDPNRFKFDSTGWDYDTRQTNLEGTLSGTFPLLGRDHELVVGASYRKEFSKAGNPWEGGGTHILDPHNFNPNQTPDSGMTPTTNPMLWANRSENTGIFSTLRLNLADSTKLILGGRLGWYEQQGTGWYFGQRNWRKAVRQNAEFTPFAGIVQDLDDRHSVYASYAQIFQPQGAVDLNGKQLDPMTGTNLEIGIKGEYFDGALNTNLALYQIKQRNRAISDEENCPAGGPLSCSRAAGEIESKGVDVEISGALTPRWQVGGGYTFNLARYTKDSNPARIGQRLNNEVPRHLFKMFTNYRPGGQWHRWNVGASVYMQSPIEIDEGVFHAYQGTYAVVGLMAGYQVNSKLNLVLNVDNLFDRHYRTALGASWSGSNVRHGAPLNAMLRLEYKM